MARQNKSHLTAMTRSKPSAPVKWLVDNGLVGGDVLDFGCGRGFDVEWMEQNADCIPVGYDPHFQPYMPPREFDTVVCVYVLNCLDKAEQTGVLQRINSKLRNYGVAYIAVRNDKSNLNGWTKRGTYQTEVNLPYTVVHECAGFKIYRFRRD